MRPAFKLWLALASLCLSIVSTSSSWAQAYPSQPIKLIVAFSPGTGSDILARLLAEKLTESWGKPFVVDNRSGAGGTIALSLTANAAPDGYTMMMISGSQITNAVLMTKLNLDVLKAYRSEEHTSELQSH